MNRPRNIFSRYELPLFFLLTYPLSWWSIPFAQGGILPHGPALAAVITLALASGRAGLRELWQRLTNFRAGKWYLIGPAIILAYQGMAFIANILRGATQSSPLQLPAMGVVLQLLLLGGQWEEIGWSGFALPKLQQRFANRTNGPLIAALVLGVFRSLWHLPLFLSGNLYWFDILIFSFTFQLIIAWIFNRSGGSLPAVMLFHFLSNLMGSIGSSVFTGTDRVAFYALFMGFAALIALVIVWASRLKMGYREGTQAAMNI